MRAEEGYRLRHNSKYLETNLDVEAVLKGCMEKGILDDDDRMRIQREKSPGDRASKLLRIVTYTEDDSVYKKFLQVLRDCGQSALCQQLEATVVPPEIQQQASFKGLTVVDVRGARAVFNKKIYRGKSVVDLSDLDLRPSPDTDKRVSAILKDWANGKEFIALMSEHLPLHLDLPVRTYPPSHNFFQVLLLGEKLPFLLLTLYDRTSMDEESERSVFEAFAMDCARELTSHLFNFYLKDFILLPCTLLKESFSVESLKKEVEVQLDFAADFYGGPSLVAKENFEELAQAVSLVATASEVPRFLDGPDDAGKKWILWQDPDSDRALRQLIWCLQADDSSTELQQPIYLEKAESANMVLLEAAKRLSYCRKVIIVSDNEKIQDCVKKMADFTIEEYGLHPSRLQCLSIQEASSGELDVQSGKAESSGGTSVEACVIPIDAPGYVGRSSLRMKLLKKPQTSTRLGSSAVAERLERHPGPLTTTTHEDEEAVEQAVPVEQVSCCEVVKMLRHHLEKGNEDVTLADQFAEEDIDGKALVLLTDQHLQQLFPHLKMGPRLRLMEHIKATIEGLQKPPENVVHEEKNRYIDDTPTEVTGKELEEFMDAKEQQSRLREECEKGSQAQPAPKPDLHRKLHSLLTDGKDYEMTDIFPLLVLSPVGAASPEYVQNFSCIKSLEPFCVFDFGPPSPDLNGESHPVYNMLENQQGEVYETLTTDNFDRNSQENSTGANNDAVGKLLGSLAAASFRPWVFCNGYGPLQKVELRPAAWKRQRGQGFKKAVCFYRERIPHDNARILIFLLSGNYEVLLGAFEDIIVNFPEQWILIAESEKIAQKMLAEVVRRSYVEKEVLEERCVIGMPWSQVSQSILKICGHSSNSGCVLPSSTDSPCHMKEKDRNSLPDLEILSITQCSDEEFVKQGSIEEMEEKKRSSEEEFYRGKQVSWWNFYFRDHVLRRSLFDRFLNLVQEKLSGRIPDDEQVAVVTLYHQPGAGGTTTARQILWELREEFRCCVIKQISDPRQTSDQITTLRNFGEPESPKPPLVLIDNEDEEKVLQLCFYLNEKARREAGHCQGRQKTFCVLVICVRMASFPKMKEDSIMLNHELQPEEELWFRTKYKTLEERYKKKQLTLHPRLLISFNIIKENFNPDYIKRAVQGFVGEIKDFKERRFLKFLALINSFDPDFQSIPMSCFNAIMNPDGHTPKSKPQLGQKRLTSGNVHWEASLSDALNILLNRTPKRCMGGNVKAVSIINNNFSREILNHLCQQENQTVSDVILEFLHTDIFLWSNESSVQAQLIKTMKDVLKKRAPFKKGREKFSPIILEIGRKEDYDLAAEVLEVGFHKFDDPMIAQQIARIYIQHSNWKAADEFARAAQDMRPRNSYLCDTHGQVFKAQLTSLWKECFENEEQLEGEKAAKLIDVAFKAIEIFRREQKLSDEDRTSSYNNCGFFSELQVLVTLLDCCRFLKAFKMDDGKMLHSFLVDGKYIPDGLLEELGEDRIQQLKNLHRECEKPMRRLEDEQIQLKEDSCYQYRPGYTNSLAERHMFIRLKECLDSYFGEDDDRVPQGMSKEDACEYRRRRVKRKGGNSLSSIHRLRDEVNAVEEFRAMYSILEQNVRSEFCSAFDLKTILNVVVALISKDSRYAQEISLPLEKVLAWTQELYEKSKVMKEMPPYLEAYLYLVMMNWPTEWRNSQHFKMFPCSKMGEVIKEWKEAFQNAHPAQKEEEGRKPDRRKGTTLFFLGQGEGFEEIVFYSELRGTGGRGTGESVWDSKVAQKRLKRLRGTLLRGGSEMSVNLSSQRGSSVALTIPTSYPIRDRSLWQKGVHFVLGFCWSGPRAYSVTRDDSKVYLGSVHTPLSLPVPGTKHDGHSQQKQLSEQTEEKFWKNWKNSQAWLEKVDKELRYCIHKDQKKALEQRKKTLERDKETLLQKRTSVLVGPD